MAEPRIWTELLTYGLGVALSPIHIVLLLLLLLGVPLRRGGLFVGGWLLTSALAVILLTLGHGLLLDMTHATTDLDLIGGGIALGGRELNPGAGRDAAPLVADQQRHSPDDLLLFAKDILAAQAPAGGDLPCSIGFSTAATWFRSWPC